MSQAVQVFGTRKRPDDTLPDATPGSIARPSGRRAAPGLARSAAIVGAAFVLSRILGLARETILASQFGTEPEIQAYVSAFRIPDLLFLVVMAGAFGAAFIPVFGAYLSEGDDDKAWRLASAVMTWCAIAIVVLSVLCFVFARPLMWIVSPGFDRETEDIAVDLMRILLLSPVFLGLGIAAKGILEAQHQFTLPALAPLVYNGATIVGALFFVDRWGIHAVAWAVIIGAAGHFLVQVPGLIRAGIRYTPSLDRTVEGLSEVWRLFSVRVIGLAAFQINWVAVTAFASHGDSAHVAGLNYAWQLLMLPHGVLALSVSTVIFPTLAGLFAQGKRSEFLAMFESAMRPLLFLMVPASVGLLLAGVPIIRLLLQRGEFDAQDTAMVHGALVWFAIGLVGYGFTEVLTRLFYAMKDTRTPVVTTVLTIVLNLFLCAFFVGRLEQAGLALALSLTTGAEAVIMILFLRKRVGKIVSDDFFPWFAKVLAAGLGMGVVILVSEPWLERILDTYRMSNPLLWLGVAYAFGLYALSFFVFAWIFRIPQLGQVTGRFASRLPGPLRRIARSLDLA
jgi:putative peptidoglycan lipid II flippase